MPVPCRSVNCLAVLVAIVGVESIYEVMLSETFPIPCYVYQKSKRVICENNREGPQELITSEKAQPNRIDDQTDVQIKEH